MLIVQELQAPDPPSLTVADLIRFSYLTFSPASDTHILPLMTTAASKPGPQPRLPSPTAREITIPLASIYEHLFCARDTATNKVHIVSALKKLAFFKAAGGDTVNEAVIISRRK